MVPGLTLRLRADRNGIQLSLLRLALGAIPDVAIKIIALIVVQVSITV